MGEVLDRAFTEQRLLDAWAEVRDAALAGGDAGRQVEQSERAAAQHISELAPALAGGTFEPRPVVRVKISKPDGRVRKLAVPGLTDRIAGRALLVGLDALACLAGARDAGAAWVARCDIDDCFDRIPRWEVLRRLRDVVPDRAVVDLVRRFMDCPVIGEHVAHAERGLGLHQGSPLSPLLCNLYLDLFDRAMLARGYRAIRYSDDIAIPVPDRGSAEVALSDAATELGELRLTLDPVKSQVLSFDAGVPFLGAVVTSLTSPGALALSHPMETVVYVDRPGSLIRSRGDRIVVEHQGQALFRLNFKRIRQVVCIGQVGMTTPFLQRALRDGIDVIMPNEHGGPGGRLASLACTDATARRAQYRSADDEHAARELAKAFVDGKIANMRVCLLRAGRRVPDLTVTSAAETMAITRLVLGDATSYDQVLGYEGIASREYFRAWRQIVGDTWGFTARERRPPPDPVNAMLSFGYILLIQEAIAALESAGLDSAVGFLHRPRWGRPSLALDLMEEFRPVIVDTMVLRCVSTGIVRPEEFTTTPDLGCRMSARARQAFIAAYERRMLTLFTHEPAGRRVSYRVGLGLQARALARALLETDRVYRSVRWK
jgi:CRISPR-associated protein Cas1